MNIDLKGVTFSILLAILGSAMILAGAAQKITLAGTGIEVVDNLSRILLIVVGGGLLVYAGILQRQEINQKSPVDKDVHSGESSDQIDKLGNSNEKTSIDSIFLNLDDDKAIKFPEFVEGALKVQILARTIVNLIGQYGLIFERLAQDGCEIQLLIVDPGSAAAKYLYGNNYDLYRSNAHTALSNLVRLQKMYPNKVRIRLFSNVPTVSIINVERSEVQKSFAQVQLYFVLSAIGRDRPIFNVYAVDGWYEIFCREFVSIWKISEEMEAASIIERV